MSRAIPHLAALPEAQGEVADAVRRRRTWLGTPVAEGEGLSHDVRNLLGAIGLYCDLLSMPGVVRQGQQHYVGELRQLGQRSGALLERLLRLGQRGRPTGAQPAGGRSADPQLGGAVGEPQKTRESDSRRLREIVERCAGVLRRMAGEHALEFRFGPGASTPVRVTEEAVERILTNLVSNASAALNAGGDRGGLIVVTLGMGANRRDDSDPEAIRRVQLMVEDSGCGMDAAQLDRVVRPSRASASLRTPAEALPGRGIGLRVVKELVAASGGELQIASEPGVGTRVRVEWKVAPVGEAQVPPLQTTRAGVLLPGRIAC